jgi:3-deoxy-manno-octulosonate cytidylyltransferase (CMP-KDO synthetase)
MKIVAFIPARLESKRFPSKVLKPIYGLPMIEHVRRRALVSNAFDEVYIVTNSLIIKKKLKKFNPKIILTKKRHTNGTSRVSEISKKYKFDYATILFADEPFINPIHLKNIVNKIKKNKKNSIFNITTNIKNKDMNSPEVVKTMVDKNNNIKDYFRLSKKKLFYKISIKKSSGILIMKNKLIKDYKFLKIKKKEKTDKIEQFRFLENSIKIKSIFIKDIYPSINTKKELKDLLYLVRNDKKEIKLINKIKNFEY